MLDVSNSKEKLVVNIVKCCEELKNELVKAELTIDKIDNSRIRSIGMIIVDSANVAMGTQRLDFKAFENTENYKTFCSSIHKISIILLQSQCIETRERVGKVIEEMEVRLTKSMYNWSGENVKPDYKREFEKLENQFRKKYGEEIKY